MLFHAEGRGFETVHTVARCAFAACPFGKLAAMRIGLVTIHAFLEQNRLLEISAGMALHAFDSSMLTEKRELCFGMIEAFI